MTETIQSGRTPWHLWAVGGVSVLWNAFGCYDYVMTVTGGEEYLRSYGMTEEQIAYYAAMPAWLTGVWAIGVWGGLAASLLLLLRSKWALHAFVASLAGFLVSLIYTYALTNGMEIAGAQGLIMNVLVGAACAFFAWYAWAMTKRGVLR